MICKTWAKTSLQYPKNEIHHIRMFEFEAEKKRSTISTFQTCYSNISICSSHPFWQVLKKNAILHFVGFSYSADHLGICGIFIALFNIFMCAVGFGI